MCCFQISSVEGTSNGNLSVKKGGSHRSVWEVCDQRKEVMKSGLCQIKNTRRKEAVEISVNQSECRRAVRCVNNND